MPKLRDRTRGPARRGPVAACAQAVQKKVGDSVGHTPAAGVGMGRHADAPEHDQNRNVQIEAAEDAHLGPVDQKRANLSFESRETLPQHGAAAFAEVAASPLDGTDGWSQTADPVEYAGHDPAQAALDRACAGSQGADLTPKLFERAFERLDKQSLFGGEVAVERRLGDARRRRNGVHVNVGIGVFREQADSGLADALPPLYEHGAVRASTHGLMAI